MDTLTLEIGEESPLNGGVICLLFDMIDLGVYSGARGPGTLPC